VPSYSIQFKVTFSQLSKKPLFAPGSFTIYVTATKRANLASPGAPDANHGQSYIKSEADRTTNRSSIVEHGCIREGQEVVYGNRLSKRSWRAAVPHMPQDWERELVLLAGMLQKKLGRLPCALVRYMHSKDPRA